MKTVADIIREIDEQIYDLKYIQSQLEDYDGNLPASKIDSNLKDDIEYHWIDVE